MLIPADCMDKNKGLTVCNVVDASDTLTNDGSLDESGVKGVDRMLYPASFDGLMVKNPESSVKTSIALIVKLLI